MSPRPRLRPDLALTGYHSPQVPAEVRLNTNESPYPPPARWRDELAEEIRRTEFHRYPDRGAAALRAGLADLHGVGPDEIFCANGSNEVLQCLLLAFGGTGRRAALFEPTYALHAHIARITGTEIVAGTRTPDFEVEPEQAVQLAAGTDICFLCSPNNPTGRADPPELVRRLVGGAAGLVVVDEAYGQFAPWSALALRDDPRLDTTGLAVVRTFSKTWAMAASRLGYLVADPAVVAGCEAVALPYHLSVPTQAAGVLALRYRDEMAARVAAVTTARQRLADGLAELPVTTWPSEANFLLFRPDRRDAAQVWKELVAAGVLVRDCSTWRGLEGCLRVTVGTPEENRRFLDALGSCLMSGR